MDSSERSEEGNLLQTRDIENDNPRITSRADAKSKELVTRREPYEEEREARVACRIATAFLGFYYIVIMNSLLGNYWGRLNLISEDPSDIY